MRLFFFKLKLFFKRLFKRKEVKKIFEIKMVLSNEDFFKLRDEKEVSVERYKTASLSTAAKNFADYKIVSVECFKETIISNETLHAVFYSVDSLKRKFKIKLILEK